MASPPQQTSQSFQDTDTHQQSFRNQNRHHDRPHHAAQQPHNPNQPMNYMPSVRAASEKKLGLLYFCSPQNHGWHGDVRKRFTDFLVNEIQKNGEVLHLSDYNLGARPTDTDVHIPGEYHQRPQRDTTQAPTGDAPASTSDSSSPQVSDEDLKTLCGLLDEPTTQALKNLYETVGKAGKTRLDPRTNSVKFPPMERSQRGKIHQNSRAGGQRHRSTQPSFKKMGGDYLHFTLYKENKDTMDAVNQIARMLKVKANNFGFAGTKDRRAATVQRISVFRAKHQTLDFLNSLIPAIKMGDYKYSKYPIQLGDHGGNEFKITVKNISVSRGQGCSLKRRVQMTTQAVEFAVSEMAKYGFINYFGLQRFGTHFVGTHELGKMLLMEDYDAVIDGILHVDAEYMSQVMSGSVEETPANRDEINRVRAIIQWKTTKNAKAALQYMPKRFGSEMNVISHLAKNPRDPQGAILTITRGMRNLYLHAYQSYVWNHAVSHRWAKYGSKVIPGDLVLVTSEKAAVEVAEDGGDAQASDEPQFQRARHLTEAEVQSGKFTVFDLVLPCPGYDVIYPDNDTGEFYVEFMSRPENGRLNPHQMRRAKKDFSLSGAYRHIVGRFIGEPKWEVRTYTDDNEQMRPTDANLIEQRKAELKAQEITKDPEGLAATIGWNTFAANPAVQDDKIDAERRRQMKENPEVEPRVNEVWVQRSEDGSLKRIKTKHEVLPVESQSEEPARSTASSGGAPLFADDTEGEGKQPAKPVAPDRQPTVPESGNAGFAATPKTPKSELLAPCAKAEVPTPEALALQNALAMKALNKHLQDPALAIPSTKTAAAAEGPETSKTASRPNSSGSERGAGIQDASIEKESTPASALPKAEWFKKRPDDRMSSQAVESFTQKDLSGVDESTIKIAVILEFSLNSSAYATVVLRELMAEVEPEKEGSPLNPS
ncbi:pseudouridine synthase TruD/Pus7 [Diaporthe amygdali]|uniref:pseudouridine synthase TruD/Pus7 n=1 Tax=Phomopsis amygdali TaxID=1214568 RepID=UPI0022FDFDF8|nr:pseudouridine synthase TruD/Pus7 [Diaporthe amygdali]KAJ0118478.1 pseudouridine synthase TruD/Pus7 [Diaporthe amygdali]